MNTLQIDNLTKFIDNQLVIDNFSFDFGPGIYAIFGQNHSGKSTLLNTIVDSIKDTKPNINLNNLSCSYLNQSGNLLGWITIKENFEMVLKLTNQSVEINSYLSNYQLDQYLDYLPNELSGGTYQKLNILLTHLIDSDIILLDEPFNGLDIISKQDIYQLLKSLLNDSNKIIIFTSHNLDDITLLSDTVICVKQPLHVTDVYHKPFNQEQLIKSIK